MKEENKCGCGHNHEGHEHKHREGCCGHHHDKHEHHEHGGCGCHHHADCHHGPNDGNAEDSPVNIVKLIDDEGKEHECLHIATIEFKEKWYAIFQAMEEDDADENTVTILQIVDEKDEERLLPIEDKATLDAVFEEFCKLMDEEEGEGN